MGEIKHLRESVIGFSPYHNRCRLFNFALMGYNRHLLYIFNLSVSLSLIYFQIVGLETPIIYHISLTVCFLSS
ncbi:hypothetical protein MBAV_006210 [Candidatus Magnetobacterium bavaricum]|uniref:Uncharacterized protein n=1 Tax=Candidatus Magnetobacterium bavaricum TaxID=29290 RepID=A0A0F3GI81_9BACT|nr:hypothetical protein MBAV_006210 [Candidatus Magnetobacterium bavaricum]